MNLLVVECNHTQSHFVTSQAIDLTFMYRTVRSEQIKRGSFSKIRQWVIMTDRDLPEIFVIDKWVDS
jgi:hypothetical protein